MEKELESKIFMPINYASKNNMEEQIKEYIRTLKLKYPTACITKEFYKQNGVMVRATIINNQIIKKENTEYEQKLEQENVRIKERGINGIGENVFRKNNSREKNHGGNERERGGR